jgi:hypothetical protein
MGRQRDTMARESGLSGDGVLERTWGAARLPDTLKIAVDYFKILHDVVARPKCEK